MKWLLILGAVFFPLLVLDYVALALRNQFFAVQFLYYFAVNLAAIVLIVKHVFSRRAREGAGEPFQKYEKSRLSRPEAERMLQDLQALMERDKPYLDPDLTLQDLADALHVARNRLSQVINQWQGRKFRDFINAYRVEEAKRLLRESLSNGRTILDAAFEAGFNSKSAFYAAFNKAIGVNPLAFRESLRKEKPAG